MCHVGTATALKSVAKWVLLRGRVFYIRGCDGAGLTNVGALFGKKNRGAYRQDQNEMPNDQKNLCTD